MIVDSITLGRAMFTWVATKGHISLSAICPVALTDYRTGKRAMIGNVAWLAGRSEDGFYYCCNLYYTILP